MILERGDSVIVGLIFPEVGQRIFEENEKIHNFSSKTAILCFKRDQYALRSELDVLELPTNTF